MLTPAELAVLVSAGKLLAQIRTSDRRVDNAVALLRDAWRSSRGLPAGEQRTTALPSAWRARDASPAGAAPTARVATSRTR